jgi:hypothetical protein
MDEEEKHKIFQNKRSDRVYISKRIDNNVIRRDENGEVQTFSRPVRIVSKIIAGNDEYRFVSDREDVVLRTTDGKRLQIKATFYEDLRDIRVLTIQKYSLVKGLPKELYFSFVGSEIETLYNFIRNVALLPLDEQGKRTLHVISLEGFNERFGHAVRLGAAYRRKAWHETESGRKVDGLMRSIPAAVVREPLHRMRHSGGPKALLHALEHQIADHLTGDAAGTGTPRHDLSIAVIEREGHPHHLAVPASDLEAIGRPTQVRPDRDDLAVVYAARGLAGIPLQEHPVLRHQAVYALVVDPRKAAFKPFTVHQRRDPPVAVSRSLIDQRAQRLQQFGILGFKVSRARLGRPLQSLRQLRSRHAQHFSNPLHGISSSGNDGKRGIHLFSCATLTASRRISFPAVFLPKIRCSSRTCFCKARISAFATTSSSALIASLPPSLMRRLQSKIRLGAIP